MTVAFKMKEKVSRIWNVGLWVIILVAIAGPVAIPTVLERGGIYVLVGFAVVWGYLYYINVLRWEIFYADTFICDGDGAFLRYAESDAYILKRWLKENNASVRYRTTPRSLRVRVRIFVVGVGEVVLYAKGQLLDCDPRLFFNCIIRPRVDVIAVVREVMENVLLSADPARITRSDLVSSARAAIEQMLPRQAIRFHIVGSLKCSDRFIIS